MGRRAPGVEDIRYINPITGATSSLSSYIDEQGIKKSITSSKCREYKINGEWVKPGYAPHNRENAKKILNSKKGYFCKMLNRINSRENDRRKQGKFMQGENGFFRDDRRGRCDKLMAHYDKQVERYGDRCPMTLIPFTMSMYYEKFDINNQVKTFSNISPDRIFNHIDYTEQNLIFTSQLWNLTKQERPISEIMLVIRPEVLERYKAIVEERFPDQKYVL
tara:strand:- start:632 stop:1291 length:660 start_codon:yes stop_codon:yes gene_type:complete